MRYNQKSHSQFLEELWNNNEYYRAGDFAVKEEYKTCKDKLLLGTKYGDVRVRASHLLNGLKFTIESAVEKTEFAKNRIVEVHGDCFDLSRLHYTRSKDNITIGCKIHGFVEVNFNNLTQHRGCPMCGADLLKEQVKSNGGWEYSRWEEEALKSEYFESFKVYVIKCWNEEEEFYKIGKTFTSIDRRMKGISENSVMPYKWAVVKLYPLESARDTCKLEVDCKNILKDYSYTPKIYFSGYRECYSKII